MAVVNATDSDFEKLISDNQRVVVKFYADWCGPCKILGPFVDELAGEMEGKAIIGKVNVDKQRKLTDKFKVKSMPTLIFIKDNVIVDGHNGLMSKPNIKGILENPLLKMAL